MRLGILGVGNMGEAILRGVLRAELFRPDRIVIHDIDRAKVERLCGELGVRDAGNIEGLASLSDAVIYAAKPQNVPEILPELARHLKPPKPLISIAAGVRTAMLEGYFEGEMPVVRVMPNIAATVGKGAAAICGGRFARKEHLELARRIFESVGSCVFVEEELMDVVTGLSGSGPAFVFLVIESLEEAGVKLGLGRGEARSLAVQTVLGAAEMVRRTGEHPAALKAKVTSPGGTTAAGLFELESAGVRAAIIRAVERAAERAKQLGS